MTDQLQAHVPDAIAPATEAELQAIYNLTENGTYRDTGETRDPSTGRIINDGGTGDGVDDQLNVKFTTEAVFNKLLTVRNGGVPQYSDMEFVTISCPGDNDLTVHSPVTEYYKWRFPVDYERFKAGQGELMNGTPLTLWPLLTPSQIREMTNLEIRTVEQVANMSDSNAGKFASFYSLKQKAKQFLSLANDKAAQGRLQAELDQRDVAHKAEMAAMKTQMDEMFRLMQERLAAAAPVAAPEEAPAKGTKTAK